MTQREMLFAGRSAVCLACLVLIALAWPAQSDIVGTIDQGDFGGDVTLAAGATELTLTDAQGKTQRLNLLDIDQVRFNVDPSIKHSGQILLINNDKGNGVRQKQDKIKLRKGLHRITIPYRQVNSSHKLSVYASGPGMNSRVELGSELLRCFRDQKDQADASEGIDQQGYRLPELQLKEAGNRRRMLSRARYRLYLGEKNAAPLNITALTNMTLKRSGTTSLVNTGMLNNHTTNVGVVFDAFFIAEQDGEYSFTLISDDGAQLYFGQIDTFSSDTLNETPVNAPWRIELAYGGVARGKLNAIADETMSMHVPLVSDMTISLSHVRSAWDKKVDPATINRDNEPDNQDTLYVRDKQDPTSIRSVNGKITALDDASLKFIFRGQERTITRDRLAGLVFKHDSRPKPESVGTHQVLVLQGGQALPCQVKSIGKHVTFTLLGGGQAAPPRDAVRAMRIENGRRIDLTRLAPNAEEAIPYFGLKLPYRLNTDFAGNPIVLFNEKTYTSGLAVHSKSRLHYKLKPNCERFQASFGMMNPGGKLGNVTARVLGDGKVLWEQADITAKTDVIDIDIELKGVERLILEVDFGQGQNVGDRAAWCNPRLIYASKDQP